MLVFGVGVNVSVGVTVLDIGTPTLSTKHQHRCIPQLEITHCNQAGHGRFWHKNMFKPLDIVDKLQLII